VPISCAALGEAFSTRRTGEWFIARVTAEMDQQVRVA